MSVPVTGALLIALSIYFFFFAPRMLYLATVFLIPFSAMAVANVGWGGGEKGIGAWVFMGTLWMARTAISKQPFWRHKGWRLTRRARKHLLLLLGCGFISLLVPLFMNGTAWVEYYRLYSNETMPLQLDAQRVTQTGYFVFGVVLVIFVAVENCDPRRLLQSVRTYIVSSIFVSLWGFVQLWCILTGHSYPAFLFNNSMGTSAQLYTEHLSSLGLHRVSSVAVEPSQLAFSMLIAFVILLVSIGFRRPILSRKWDVSALLLVTGALIISTSTTAYAGIVLASGLAVLILARAGAVLWRYVLIAAATGAAGIAIALTVPLVRDLIELVIVSKAQSYSAMERLHSSALAAHYFIEYPLFGMSWNAASSGDLMFEVLASLGIVGFLAFAVFLGDELLQLWRGPARGSRWSVIVAAAVLLSVALSESVGFPFAMGYVWFVWGLGISAPFVVSSEAVSRASARAVASRGRTDNSGGLSGPPYPRPSGAEA